VLGYRGRAINREAKRCDVGLFAVAGGLGGHTAGVETTLTAVLLSGGCAELAHIGDSRAFRLRSGRLRQIIEDHTISKPRRQCLLLAPGPLMARLDDRPDRSADMGLRDLWCGSRYLLCAGGLSPVIDDRPHCNVLTLRAASADAPASWLP
jgi:serine/threonine protein phosphatase PrpC